MKAGALVKRVQKLVSETRAVIAQAQPALNFSSIQVSFEEDYAEVDKSVRILVFFDDTNRTGCGANFEAALEDLSAEILRYIKQKNQ